MHRLLFAILGMEEMPSLILCLFVVIAILFLTYLFIRWVFEIKRQLWNQKQQINLLIKIAEKLGVDKHSTGLADIEEKNNKQS